MSDSLIPDLTTTALLRLGRTAQINALARRTHRTPIDRYNPLRDPWAHAFFPGQDHRLGKLSPADAIIAEELFPGTDLRRINFTPREVELLDALKRITPTRRRQTLEQICSTPAGGSFGTMCPLILRPLPLRKRPPDDRQPRPPQQPRLPNINGGIALITWTALGGVTTSALVRRYSTTVAAPARLTGLAISLFDMNTGVWVATIEIPELGVSLAWNSSSIRGLQMPYTLPLDIEIRTPVRLIATIEPGENPPGTQGAQGNAALSWAPLPGPANLQPRTIDVNLTTGVQYDLSPYIQLDPSIATAFDAAEIPDEWYITR
jgi:hypothetical protein